MKQGAWMTGMLLCAGLRVGAEPPPYVVFDHCPLKGGYFYSQVANTGDSWVENVQGKVPCVTAPSHSPGSSLALRYHSAPGGNWKVVIQRHPIRGLDEWDNGVFIQARATPYAAPRALRIWLRGPLKSPPQVAVLKERDEVGPFQALPQRVDANWVCWEMPLAMQRAEEVKGLVVRQGETSQGDEQLWIDDVEVVGQDSSSNPSPPDGLEVESGQRHVDIHWTPLPHRRMWVERAWPGQDFEPIGVTPYWLDRYCDYRGEDRRPARYRVCREGADGRPGPPSAVVEAAPSGEGQDNCLDMVQKACLRYYWEGAEPHSGLTLESRPGDPHMVAMAASGFGLLALLVGAERGFLPRQEVLQRMDRVVTFLEKADRFHGIFPHYLDGRSGRIVAFFGPDDNGGDLLESAYLFQGLLCARQYFDRDDPAERALRGRITALWEAAEWDWYRSRENPDFLLWHWSPDKAFKINHPLVGWNETMMAYLLAIASPTHSIPASMYYSGWAGQSQRARDYRGNRDGCAYTNGKSYYGVRLPVGVLSGGPLFFTHYNFLAMDPRGLRDRFTDYFENCRCIAEINRRYCVQNGYAGQGWGLTASDGPWGYHPDEPLAELDKGKLTPTGAIASMPYLPEASLQALKQYYEDQGAFVWGEMGFRDAFSPRQHWVNDLYMGLNQAPMVVMIENYRSGLLWRLLSRDPEIQSMRRKVFEAPGVPGSGAKQSQ